MDMLPLEALALPAALGIGLAAASGFRVFVPLLVLGLAAHWGYVPVGESFAWVATTPALLMLAVAALFEIAAYYVPGLDNLLDAIAGPAAVIAGIAVSAAVMTDLPPMLKWTLAIIAVAGAGRGPDTGCHDAHPRRLDRDDGGAGQPAGGDRRIRRRWASLCWRSSRHGSRLRWPSSFASSPSEQPGAS